VNVGHDVITSEAAGATVVGGVNGEEEGQITWGSAEWEDACALSGAQRFSVVGAERLRMARLLGV
jgi:hypothetical protein